jgi:hypothetical protein
VSAEADEEGGLGGRELLKSCWRAYQKAREGLSSPVPDLVELEPAQQYAFLAACQKAQEVIDDGYDNERETTYSGSALLLAEAAAKTLAGDEFEPEPVNLTQRIAFEAVFRHILNVRGADSEDLKDLGLDGHEDVWLDWAQKQLIEREGEHCYGGEEGQEV